ncbi:mobilization protein MbpA [Phocaeicola vulgatus]
MFRCGNGREKRKKCVAMQCVSAVCIPMRYVYIARSVLVGQFLLFSLCSKRFFAYLRGMEVRRNEKITFRCSALEKAALSEQAARCGLSTSEYCRSLSLGGRPRERYTEEERELLRDIARLKGTLQRLNNYFGGRQYREVFEENRTLITELQKILSR